MGKISQEGLTKRGYRALLTVKYEKTKTGSGLVEVHSDEDGAELLIKRFSRFVERAKRDYDHFMTPSWAGHELTEKRLNPQAELINKMDLRFWPVEEE